MSDQTEPQDDAEYPIEHSPLECDISRDETTVRIFIYRGRHEPGWLLEIEDEHGGSTCWDDYFDSDQAALDEALRAIDEQGIRSFTDVRTDPAAMQRLWRLTTAEPAISELRQILSTSDKTSSFERACGVLAAVASVPGLRAPSEWLDLINGDHVFRDVADAQRFASGVMELNNEVVRSVTDCSAHCCPPAEDHEAVRRFCEGYVQIASHETAAFRDPRAMGALMPICALAGAVPETELAEVAEALGEAPEQFLQRARANLSDNVMALHAYWSAAREQAAMQFQQRALPQRRASPKVGRNDRCPCGSGKKFKKCCAR